MPSAPYSSISALGVTTLPPDFDIFLRSGSRTQPLMRAADQPVGVEPLDPVLVPDPHELRVPAQLPAALEQALAEGGVAAAVADVPLPAGDDLEGMIPLLVELDGVGDRPRLANQVAAVP